MSGCVQTVFVGRGNGQHARLTTTHRLSPQCRKGHLQRSRHRISIKFCERRHEQTPRIWPVAMAPWLQCSESAKRHRLAHRVAFPQGPHNRQGFEHISRVARIDAHLSSDQMLDMVRIIGDNGQSFILLMMTLPVSLSSFSLTASASVSLLESTIGIVSPRPSKLSRARSRSLRRSPTERQLLRSESHVLQYGTGPLSPACPRRVRSR